MTESERPQQLTAEKKLKLYLETRLPNAPVGEIIRRYGIHLDDLRQIEQVVESAAIAGLKATGRKQRPSAVVTPERIAQLEAEVAEQTTALAEMSVAYTLLGRKIVRRPMPSSGWQAPADRSAGHPRLGA